MKVVPPVRAIILIATVSCGLNAAPTGIADVRLRSSAGSTQLVLYLESKVQYKVERLPNSERLYLDLQNVTLRRGVLDQLVSFHDVLLSRIQVGQNESATRIMLDLSPAADSRPLISMESDPPRLVIEIRGRGSAPPAVPTAVGQDRVLRIPKVSRPPKLQDFLNGTPREAEAVVTDFRQREPGDGVPATQKTTAYLSYDDTNLYIVFECQDDLDKIRGRLARREDIDDDDQVVVYLDTFRTRQRAYIFAVNPLGVQKDGVMVEGEEDPDFNFDTLWYSEGKISDHGYVVWISIPFKSVRFSSAVMQTWGIALGRVIVRNSENSFWPYITQRIQGFVPQMGILYGLQEISPGHNLQVIPYLTYTGEHYLDTSRPAYVTTDQGRGGMDAKAVLKDSLTLDVALNPDFSEVESDDPQVTVNQRYEVFYPEKRPFFLENANFFRTPVDLFYSRRIADPQFGVRLTGTVDRWNIGVLTADDRAPGELLEPSDPLFGRETDIGVVRIQREFGDQSSIGVLGTSQDLGSSSNRVFSMDTRLKLSQNWTFSGQAIHTETRNQDTSHLSGAGYLAALAYSGRHFSYAGNYTDLSPGFRAPLGFVPRVNIRQINQEMAFLWRPKRHRVQYFGPTVTTLIDWDRKGVLQDWLASLDFTVHLSGETDLKAGRSRSFELLSGPISPTAGINPDDTVDTGTNAGGPRFGFRKEATTVEFSTAWLRWLGISTSYSQGTGVNYSPGSGLAPFLGNTRDATIIFTVRPAPRIRFDQMYIYSGLGARAGFTPTGVPASAAIFNNHLVRWKANIQFTRALSFRTIIDYNALLSNEALIAEQGYKQITGNLLLTYQINTGTALYIGYNNQYQNLALDETNPPALRQTVLPTIPTGRQIFIKLNYLFRF